MSAADARLRTVTTRAVRVVIFVVAAAGIAGMIVGSIADNNGMAITFGLIVAVAALVLMVVTAINPARPLGAVDEKIAARVEKRIVDLVAAGTEEEQLRALVRDAVALGRTAG